MDFSFYYLLDPDLRLVHLLTRWTKVHWVNWWFTEDYGQFSEFSLLILGESLNENLRNSKWTNGADQILIEPPIQPVNFSNGYACLDFYQVRYFFLTVLITTVENLGRVLYLHCSYRLLWITD